ncbi:hypothetical protein OZ668_15275 [Elizabethkingia sp. HX XZB]|uniref:helix-turn-helix transcriptional regulator n=1 Tax=Elizabethkingia sp. HX XZB TaxID=3003193 RepID=UPI002A243037|nr:hypothetical protein [Elizabethkingia sp. HX XZB]MDX8569361.1 hypothetical protein [Elizabethkingia sp. HX XZB]
MNNVYLFIIEILTLKHQDEVILLRIIVLFLILAAIFIWRKYEKERNFVKNEELKTEMQMQQTFLNLIKMAKSNSPYFWMHFQNLFPQFIPNLLKINSTLKTSELTFCAYLFLGFTTKEIAKYTSKAPKTIINNRYNLRKKLDMLPHEDLITKLKNLS